MEPHKSSSVKKKKRQIEGVELDDDVIRRGSFCETARLVPNVTGYHHLIPGSSCVDNKILEVNNYNSPF